MPPPPCPGLPDGPPCMYSQTAAGQPALARRRGERCLFCDSAKMAHAAANAKLRSSRLLPAMRAFLQQREGCVHAAALLRVPQEWRSSMPQSSARDDPPTSNPLAWQRALLNRRLAGSSEMEESEYLALVRRDRRRPRKKFFQDNDIPAPESADIAPNDAGLPAAVTSARAGFVERWCKFGSWGMCSTCHSLLPRPLHPVDCRRVAKPFITARACRACSKHASVPQPDDVPEPLRNLSRTEVLALRPLDVCVGPVKHANFGYRVHTSMIKFAWAELDVETKIAGLAGKRHRRRARTAFAYLMASEESSYAEYVAAHRRFLRKHPAATERERRRLLSFIENEGIECCLWPHLYWRNDMTETHVRLTDVRRLRREEERDEAEAVGRTASRGRKRTFLEMHDEEASDEHIQSGRTSIKASFMRKVLGPIIGYANDFELLSFVYDLLLWSKLGASKSISKGLPIRLALQSESFSPLYWKSRHQALLDMQRQCGFPVLFKTMAPWEWSFPYHAWVLDEMRRSRVGRMGLAGPETLHAAHVFAQLETGLYTGHNAPVKVNATEERKHPGWSDHILADARAAPHQQPPVNFFFRLEFQDGQRKLPSQRYHGSGRVHCHSLNFGSHFSRARLAEQMLATVPEDGPPALKGYMLGRPHGRDDSGWPVELGENRWDAELDRVRLHHTEEDKAAGHRAFFKETLEITKCHQDVLHCDRRANSMKYCATYNAKFSDSFAQDWLCDDISGNAVARKVLFEYHPCEPEMWLYIGGRLAPPCQYSGTMVPLRVPLPTPGAEKSNLIDLYEKSPWRGDDMTFLEWMRKSGADGKIARWVQLRHKRLLALQQTTQTLQEFAQTCVMNGEKLIATDMLAMSNDKFFGQWLTLHVPFRRHEELLDAGLVDVVPGAYLFLANAWKRRPDYWSDADAVRRDLQLQSMSEAKIDTLLSMLRANLYLIDQCVHGGLRLATPAEERAALRRGGLLDDGGVEEAMQWNLEQKNLQGKVNEAVDRSLAHRSEEDDARAEEKRLDAWTHGLVIAGLGPPGTGKTTAIDACVRRTRLRGGRVLYALPTAQQAARVRGRFPDCDVDTCSGAFGLWQSSREAVHLLDLLTTYDLVVVDEISQLSRHDFNRILKLWDAASRVPALVFIGDFHQLPGVEPTNAKDSARWRRVYKVSLHQMWRCKDAALMAKLRLLRLNQPTEQQLRDICRGHKAWSHKHTPDAYDILQLLRQHPDTVVATCTRRAAALVNRLCTQVLFADRGQTCLGTVGADWEANVDNYLLDGKLKPGRPPRPQTLDLYKGLKVHLTKNLDKPGDFVNGMAAVVQSFHGPSGCLRVLTDTGKHLAVYPVTEYVEDCGTVTAYPVRAGYASTVHKLQGAELKHITVWLDARHFRAAGYVAISRVGTDDAYLLGGILEPAHFTPAT